jgi:hypothetical protein
MIRLKDTEYVTDNFRGDYNAAAYEYAQAPVIKKYRAHAFHFYADGTGGENGVSKTNENGVLQENTFVNTYNFTTHDSPFLTFVNYPGPDIGAVSLNGNVVLMAQRGRDFPGQNVLFGLYFALKRETRPYSTADLSGKWIVVALGDNSGTSFSSMIGAMHCNATGNCSTALKIQRDGLVISGVTTNHPYTVSADGTFGSSYEPPSPAYAAALGNDGQTLYLTSSLSGLPLPTDRLLLVGMRCNECAIPLERYLPLILKP